MDMCNFGSCHALAFFLIRIMLGTTFLAHGCQKVFGWFGGPGLAGFSGWIASMGLPVWLGQLAAGFELAAGLLLFLGIAAELGALMALVVMIGAIILVHGSHGFFLQNNGCEYALNLALIAVVVIIGGPGKFALWDPFQGCRK